MRDWRTRVALGAVLSVALVLAFLAGYDAFTRRVVRNPSDAALLAQFAAHRAELEREAAAAPDADSVVYLPRAAWVARMRFADVKGFARTRRPPGELVADLDDLAVRPRRRGEVLRFYRAIGDDWYLYRELREVRR